MENREVIYAGTICAVDHYATVIVVFIAMPEGKQLAFHSIIAAFSSYFNVKAVVR